MRINRYHLLFWLLYSCIITLLDYIGYGPKFKLPRELIVLALEIWIFYTFSFAIFALKNRKFTTIAKGCVLFCFSIAGAVCLDYLRVLLAAYYGMTILANNKEFFNDVASFYIQFGFYATGYFFAYRFNLKQKQLLELEKKQAEYEKAQAVLEFNNARLQADLMQSENDFLRSQINPHFLYNCLNFIYSRTFRQQPQIAETIMVLSQVMRYSLTDFSVSNGLAYVDEEIVHINNVIKINKLRYNDSLKIGFDVYGNPTNKMIAPMLLITLVENVFKHGNLQDKDFPANLVCRIDEERKRLHFSTINKRSEVAATNVSFGMGHSNIKQRLSLLYKDNFTLNIKEEGGNYYVVLEMPYFDADDIKNNHLRA
jgi:sensor histidine kinase YesM